MQLREIAHARSGDKGNKTNIGVIAYDDDGYNLICEKLTEKKVKEFFSGIALGEVKRYELPNLNALNFVLENSLDGGGSVSLKTDAQGKTYGAALLRINL